MLRPLSHMVFDHTQITLCPLFVHCVVHDLICSLRVHLLLIVCSLVVHFFVTHVRTPLLFSVTSMGGVPLAPTLNRLQTPHMSMQQGRARLIRSGAAARCARAGSVFPAFDRRRPPPVLSAMLQLRVGTPAPSDILAPERVVNFEFGLSYSFASQCIPGAYHFGGRSGVPPIFSFSFSYPILDRSALPSLRLLRCVVSFEGMHDRQHGAVAAPTGPCFSDFEGSLAGRKARRRSRRPRSLRWLANKSVDMLSAALRPLVDAEVIGTRLPQLMLHAELFADGQGRCPSGVKDLGCVPRGSSRWYL